MYKPKFNIFFVLLLTTFVFYGSCKKRNDNVVPDSNSHDANSPPKLIKLIIDDPNINIDLVYIKPGSFTMGRNVGWVEKFFSKISALAMVKRYVDDWPARKVKITKGFYIGKYKITNEQYCRFLNATDNPQDYVGLNKYANIELKDEAYIPKKDCENAPVHVVPWKGAVAFCNWFSKLSDRTVRLPTEAEWEFTACGPENRTYPWGEAEPYKPWLEKDYEAPPEAKSSERQIRAVKEYWRTPVDTFKENATPDGVVGMLGHNEIGIYGCVGEWCSDFYGAYYLKNDVIDPQGPTVKDMTNKDLNHFYPNKCHVRRGGSIRYLKTRSFGGEAKGSGFRIVVERK